MATEMTEQQSNTPGGYPGGTSAPVLPTPNNQPLYPSWWWPTHVSGPTNQQVLMAEATKLVQGMADYPNMTAEDIGAAWDAVYSKLKGHGLF